MSTLQSPGIPAAFFDRFFFCVCGVFGRARRCLDWFVYSDRDPVALEECLCREVETADQWYNKNVMIGDTEYTFSFPVEDSIDIFRMNIDNELLFDRHISSVCKMINSQLNVMLRFRN